MGSNLLRLVTAALVGLLVSLGAWAAEAPAPEGIGAPIWGLIVAAGKLVIDFLVAKLGPTRTDTTPTAPSMRSGSKSGFAILLLFGAGLVAGLLHRTILLL